MLYVLLVTALISAGPRASSGPRIEARGVTYKLVMPRAMWAALEKHAPGFAIFRFEKYAAYLFRPGLGWHYQATDQQAPFAVVGDFNGDQTKDVIVNGWTPTWSGLAAVLSRGSGFVACDVQGRAPQEPGYPRPDDHPLEKVLRLVRPGVIHSPHLEPKPPVLKADAVEEIYFEKAASIDYYIGDCKFASYTTAD